MIEFSKIIIEGFCSIPNLELQLNTDKTTIIRASNGQGKTSIFSAIVWAIYGKNLKGISDVNTWKKYRPKGYNGTKIELFFNKNNSVHKIIRCQEYQGDIDNAKGKNRLIYYIDAVPVENKSKLQIQSLIEKNLEMSYNLFINSIMFGQGLKRLIQESGSDKKKIFEEIFELQYLTKARNLAYDKYIGIKSKVSEITNKIYNTERAYKDILNLSSNIEKENIEHQKMVASKIESFEREKSISAKELIKYRHKVISLKELEANIQKVKTEINSKKNSINIAKGKTNISLKELLEKVIKILKLGDISKALKILVDIREGFNNLEKYLQELNNLETKLSGLRDKKSIVDNAQYKVKSLTDKINNLENSIQALKSSKPKSKSISGTKDKLEKYKRELSILESNKSKLSLDLNLYKWAYEEPLSNNGIKAFLFESSLDYLNETLRTYSEVLGFDIQFGVDLESSRKDFNTVITKDGVDVFYEELSGGEKQLVNLAMAFAMNEVVSKSKGINIAFLDEVFESLSQDNIEIVVSLVKKIYQGKSIFIITHQESLPISNSKTLIVNKNHGLSYYQW